MTKKIQEKKFRLETERVMRKSIGSDYVGVILDRETGSGDTIFELIKEDVEETSAWEDEGVYNEDDIKLAIGRVLSERMWL